MKAAKKRWSYITAVKERWSYITWANFPSVLAAAEKFLQDSRTKTTDWDFCKRDTLQLEYLAVLHCACMLHKRGTVALL